MSSRRYVLLDVLRGLCVLSMVLYHAMYDVVVLLGRPVSWYWEWPGYLWQQSICWTFILLSGFCWGLSHRPLRHALIVSAAGLLVTAVTYAVMPSELILCGVLTLLGLCGLLLTGLQKLSERVSLRIPPLGGMLCSLLLFFLLRDLPRGALGFEGLTLCALPDWLYQFPPAAIFGLPAPGFSSSDYFPLLPWFFLYLAGHFLRQLLLPCPAVQRFLSGPQGQKKKALLAPFAFLGRHSLLIYLLHQPVLLALFSLPALLSGQ